MEYTTIFVTLESTCKTMFIGNERLDTHIHQTVSYIQWLEIESDCYIDQHVHDPMI